MPRKLKFVLLAFFVCAPLSAKDEAVKETWDAIFIGTDKVGYVHKIVRPVTENNRPAVLVQVETVMSIKRLNQSVDMKLEYESVETPDGKMLRMDNRGLGSRTIGVVQGNAMKITLETPGKKSNQTIPWSDDVVGPGAEDRILEREPIKPGQKRSFRSFLPDLNQVVTNVYYGEEMEEVKLWDGSMRRLQRVRNEIVGVPALKNIKTFMWVDDKGEIQKTTTTMMAGMTTYRVSKEIATAPSGAFSVDFIEKTLIKVAKKIPNPYETAEIVYRVQLKDEDPAEVFPRDERQSLSKDDDGQWLLTIRSIDPAQPVAKPVSVKTEEFLASNNYLQTDHPKVIAAARQAVGDATDAWEKSLRIEKWVFENLSEKNFSKVFDSAAVVAEKLEGDCTEHAVLVAAMARVVGIPSRVAVGLVYAPRLEAFAYHMWSEVYVGRRWIPLDATLGLGHASPAHIKLADSNLDGIDTMMAFLPVARVMDRLGVEVIRWRHADE